MLVIIVYDGNLFLDFMWKYSVIDMFIFIVFLFFSFCMLYGYILNYFKDVMFELEIDFVMKRYIFFIVVVYNV